MSKTTVDEVLYVTKKRETADLSIFLSSKPSSFLFCWFLLKK